MINAGYFEYALSNKDIGIILFALRYLRANLDDAHDGDLTKISEKQITKLESRLSGGA